MNTQDAARSRWPLIYLQRAGFEPGQLLGLGQDGAVFNYRDGKVIKLTSCAGEAFFFWWLLESGGHPGFPFVEQVCRVGKWKRQIAFAIVREDVPDLVVSDADWLYWAAEDLPRRSMPDDTDWQAVVGKAYLTARPHQADLIASLLAAVEWALSRGCRLPWMHHGNLGQRDGKVVIRDLSRAEPPRSWSDGRKLPTRKAEAAQSASSSRPSPPRSLG